MLDEVCFGEYDFSYVRIDFEKGSNVGYAFANFISANSIVTLINARNGSDWAPGIRRKFAVSYATCQGLDCLIDKFRNSSVMSEFADYRPKLWYTQADAPTLELIGTEKVYPAPNNYSKTQRSHDNAGQVGLFPPRSGFHAGDRSRRSQYDRGTTAQIQEDAIYGRIGHEPNYNIQPGGLGAPIFGQHFGGNVGAHGFPIMPGTNMHGFAGGPSGASSYMGNGGPISHHVAGGPASPIYGAPNYSLGAGDPFYTPFARPHANVPRTMNGQNREVSATDGHLMLNMKGDFEQVSNGFAHGYQQ